MREDEATREFMDRVFPELRTPAPIGTGPRRPRRDVIEEFIEEHFPGGE